MPLKLEYRTGVRAPAEAIWRVLSDIEGWPRWNPLYTKAAGVIRIGAQLDLEVTLRGQAPRAIRSAIRPETPFTAAASARSMPSCLTLTSSEYAVTPPRKNSEAPEMAPILAWRRPHVRLSATASVSRGLRSISLFRSLNGRAPR